MGDWYRVIKTIKGNKYLYMQRTHRVPGRKSPITESYSLGPVGADGRRRRRNLVGAVAMAVFGVEDDYGIRVDSWWNRHVNKEKKVEPAKVQPETGKPAEAGQGGKSGFLVGGNGESPTATGSQSSSDPSGTTGSPTGEG